MEVKYNIILTKNKKVEMTYDELSYDDTISKVKTILNQQVGGYQISVIDYFYGKEYLKINVKDSVIKDISAQKPFTEIEFTKPLWYLNKNKYNKEYQKANNKRIVVDLNRSTDDDLIKWYENNPGINKNQLFKQLLREYIKNTK